MGRGIGPSPTRAAASTATGRSWALRTPNSMACALAGSSQCRSSTTTSTGRASASDRNTAATAAATVCH